MPYRRVGFLANEYYHVYNRGNNFQPIFFERDNYLWIEMRTCCTSPDTSTSIR
jgi:hypothetical protein